MRSCLFDGGDGFTNSHLDIVRVVLMKPEHEVEVRGVVSVFVFFGKIWQTFAVLGSSEKLEPELSALILGQDPGNLPDWSLDWLTLTQGLILNYSGQRQQASIKFNQVLNSTDSGAEDWISEQARRGLKQTLAEPATTANN